MPSPTEADDKTLAMPAASPAQTPSVPTQIGASEDNPAPALPQTSGAANGGVPSMPLPPANAQLAPPDQTEAVTPESATSAAAIDDPLGEAPEGASQTSGTDPTVNRRENGSTNGATNGTRGSDPPLFARRRSTVAVCILMNLFHCLISIML